MAFTGPNSGERRRQAGIVNRTINDFEEEIIRLNQNIAVTEAKLGPDYGKARMAELRRLIG